jgi:hypothetical protein
VPSDRELQVPPVAVSAKVTTEPTQTVPAPVILPAKGRALTVKTVVAADVPQTFTTVYEINVLPAAIPKTTPPASTVALPVETELQIPPGAASVRVVEEPAQALDAPVMLPETGNGLTVTVAMATAMPQVLVTV